MRFPKGERRQVAKGRDRRRERTVTSRVRPEVVERDGHCRLLRHRYDLPRVFGPCEGPSEWSHYNETHRRSKTMGQKPEDRHTRAHSLMLCRFHSQAYDQHRMDIIELTPRGCDGPLRFKRDGWTWEETE